MTFLIVMINNILWKRHCLVLFLEIHTFIVNSAIILKFKRYLGTHMATPTSGHAQSKVSIFPHRWIHASPQHMS